ncbi:PREDICTED: uncharacterized protein LOC109587791 isoform X1 [Amphimedon queenslandica]|nr:PREDICTED: uncharacterized protein LOC109587791 isoform X1 [Amphimedon queenslandica]|eukprot:XP_019859568.1 PREDICTED: uncharacterized protein LOC109587791 isoform X1 [Amphimedon queenslandica]
MVKMACFVFVFLMIMILSSSASVILSTSGNATLCLGQTRQQFLCEVAGPLLFWSFSGANGVPFSSGATTTRFLSPNIEVELLSICSEVPLIRSMATITKVTRNMNGTTLQCRNSSFVTGSIGEEVNFYVLSSTAVSLIYVTTLESSTGQLTIYASWPLATCAAMYGVSISNNDVKQTQVVERPQFFFNVTSGTYRIGVNSIDYNGTIVEDPVYATISIHVPEFDVSARFVCVNKTFLFTTEKLEEEDTSVLSSIISQISITNQNNESYTYKVTMKNQFGSLTKYGVVDTSICNDISTTVPASSQSNNAIYVASTITFALLFCSATVFILLERLRRFCPTASFWSFIFCDCLAKGQQRAKPIDGEDKKQTDMSSM